MSEPCPMCSGEIAAGQTTFTVDLGSGVVVVRHVPARVCKQCGEDWIQDPVAERLEKIVLDARTVGKIVEVIDLQAAHHSPYHERSRRGTEFLAVASVACPEPRLSGYSRPISGAAVSMSAAPASSWLKSSGDAWRCSRHHSSATCAWASAWVSPRRADSPRLQVVEELSDRAHPSCPRGGPRLT